MTNLNLYRVFYYVAKEKNLTRASEKLFISQPAVSSAMKELENQVNQMLFVRGNKGVELSTFGKLLFKEIAPIVEKCENLESLGERFDKLESGVLRIGSSTSNVNQIIMDYIKIFATKYPNIKITMKRDIGKNLIDLLRNDELDVIFTDYIENSSKDLKTVKNYEINYQLIGNKDFKQKYFEDDINVNNFPVHDLILPSPNNNSRLTIEKFLDSNNLIAFPKYELDNYILLYDFVKNGLGVAFVNKEYYSENIKTKEVEVIYPKFVLQARKIVCLINTTTSNPAVEKFVKQIDCK